MELIMSNLNKKELSEALYARLKDERGVTKSLMAKAVNAIFNADTDKDSGIIAAHLFSSKDNKVTIPGFGTFGTRHRAERIGRHPSTGAKLTIKATNVVTFKAGKGLKEGADKL